MPTLTENMAAFAGEHVTRVKCPGCGWIDIKSVNVRHRTNAVAGFYCPACDKESESPLVVGDAPDAPAAQPESIT